MFVSLQAPLLAKNARNGAPSSVLRVQVYSCSEQEVGHPAYALNNPLNFIDPTGLFCEWDDGSFDSADDPQTGSVSGCASQGGTWFDGLPSDWGLSGDWSGVPNPDFAAEQLNQPAGFTFYSQSAPMPMPDLLVFSVTAASPNTGATVSAAPAPQVPQKPWKQGCWWHAAGQGLKAAGQDFFSPPGADPLGDLGDALRDKTSQRAAVVALYVASDALRIAVPFAEIGAKFVPVAGQVLLAIQVGKSLWEGGKAFVEADNQCNGTN